MGTHSQVGCHRVSHSSEFFAEHGYLEVPSLVQWIATLRCRLSCEHCLAVSQEAGFADTPIEKVRGLIDEVAAMGVREFLITGGEPLVREDLAEVIQYLGSRGVNWSLNTAAMPGAGLREAIARSKPGFVAVSLDGPKDVHDGFRGKAGAYEEATEAIRFFKSLGVKVCAGTTVTSRNYDYLDETFHLVAASDVDRWGIHLLVPEGRAAQRKDLFLSKAQLKRLIKFVARKRRYFPVEMADEIGYLGYVEPLVRDIPLSCGAGRAQCVVLPDGAVVPCTTLDRTCCAGNVHERLLAQIWTESFQDLRLWRPSGKCSHCDYSPACRGGCWLQRKSGTQCFKEVWHVPGALKTAAGIAICLGGLAVQEDVRSAGATAGEISPLQTVGSYRVTAAAPVTLDEAILTFYINQAAGQPVPSYGGINWNDPGWKFFKEFTGGTLPHDTIERCTAVRNALDTQEPSLSLIALLWRAVIGPLFEIDSVKQYDPPAGRQAIRDTLAALKLKAEQWRLEIFARQLDPYLSNARQTPRPVQKKSASSPVYVDRYPTLKDLNEERWGVAADPETLEAAEAYLLAHHYADQMDLSLEFTGAFTKHSGSESEVVSAGPKPGARGRHTIGVFDVISTDYAVTFFFELRGSLRASLARDSSGESLLRDEIGEQDLDTSVPLALSSGYEYTYVELLNLLYQRVRNPLLPITYGWLSPQAVSLWNQDLSLVAAVYPNGALLWPAIREILAAESALPPVTRSTGRTDGVSAMALPAEIDIAEVHRRAVLKDTDFWMF